MKLEKYELQKEPLSVVEMANETIMQDNNVEVEQIKIIAQIVKMIIMLFLMKKLNLLRVS